MAKDAAQRGPTQPAPQGRGRPLNPHAVHRHIADDLRQQIIGGAIPPNEILPSLRQLARTYHTSLDTAQAAIAILRKEGRVAPTPRMRLAVVPGYGALPGMTARGMVLEVLTKPLQETLPDPNWRALQAGIETAVGERAAPLTILHEDHFSRALPSSFLEWPLAGIVLNGMFNREVLDEYQRLTVPVVLVDQPPGKKRISAVCVDNRNAARDATRRVLALGHRRIAFLRRFSFIRQEIDPDSKEREAGFRKACAENGLRVTDECIFTIFHTETPNSPSIQAVAGSKSDFTAAVAADPTIARLLATAALKAGRKVPRDLSIVCFQGRETTPAFTGMVIDFHEMGREAVHQLFATAERPRTVMLPPKWVDAGSLGPCGLNGSVSLA